MATDEREKELTINKLKHLAGKFSKGGKLGITEQEVKVDEYDYWAITKAVEMLGKKPKIAHRVYSKKTTFTHCSECGYMVMETDKFCATCGLPLEPLEDNKEN